MRGGGRGWEQRLDTQWPQRLGANWPLIDRAPPTLPTVTGGSSTCKGGTITITAGATDATSAIASFWCRMSVDNGTTWSLTPIMGQAVTFTTPGRWLVQFQAVDEAGNATAWASATAGAANTACHT